MWKNITALLYTFITISNALDSNSSLLQNKALTAETMFIGKEELQFVVSLGVFKDECYMHICLAVMITGLNGLTSGICGHYDYYAYRAGLNKREENRTKLHVNTKRPIYFDPDKFYAVIRFIDFDEDLFDQSTKGRRFRIPDIGVIVLKKTVQYTRPILNVPISRIKELPRATILTLIGMNTIEGEPSGEKTLKKKSVIKSVSLNHQTEYKFLKPYQFLVKSDTYKSRIFREDDLGGPVYWGNQFVGILVENWYGVVVIDAVLEKDIDKIIASTWIPRMKERKLKRKAEASTSSAITS